MRISILLAWFLVLVGALYLLWQYRFERSPEIPTVRLADLKTSAALGSGVRWDGPEEAPRLILQVNPAPSGVVARFELPISAPVDFLHLKVRVSSNQLIPGKEYWQDGRGLIEWHQADDKAGQGEWENDSFGSARWDQQGGITEFVMRPEHPPAVPAMRLENLGTSGEFALSVFEASVVRERWVWKIGRWFLMAGWMAWAIAWIRLSGTKNTPRVLLAAGVWLLAGIYFVVPGPWRIQRSFGPSFELGGSARFSQNTNISPTPDPGVRQITTDQSPDALKSVGEIPEKGDLVLRLKRYAEPLRPMLHGFLLFGPTLLIACLVGRKPALSLAVILALAIEVAQNAFGYGFDSTDLFDLAYDGVGIVLALGAHAAIKRHFPTMNPGGLTR